MTALLINHSSITRSPNLTAARREAKVMSDA